MILNTYKHVKNRITSIDLLKFFSMIFISVSHCLQRWGGIHYTNSLGFSIFYSVSLAFFFFSGGFLIKRTDSFKEMLIYCGKTILLYLIPAYVFSCLSIWTLPRFTLLDKNFAYWMNELYLRTDTFYWYFLVAAFINIFIALSYYLTTLIKNKGLGIDVLKAVAMISLSIGYLMIFRWIYTRADLGPGCLSANMVLYYFPISLIAFLLRMFQPYLEQWPKVNILKASVAATCLGVYVPILIIYRDWLPGLSSSFSIILGHWFGSFCGTIVYFYLFSIIGKSPFFQRISVFGSYSGPFYLVHVYILRLLASYISRPAVMDGPAISFVMFLTLIFTLGSFAITVFLCFIPYTDFFLFLNYKRLRDIFLPHQWVAGLLNHKNEFEEEKT